MPLYIYTLLAVLAAVLILSLRGLSRTRHKLAKAQFVLTQRKSVRRKNAALRLAISENPSSYRIEKCGKEIYIHGLHDSQRLETTIPTTVKVYRFNNAEEEAYAQLLAEELLDKLNEDI